MAWVNIPLPGVIYKTGEEDVLDSKVGAQLIDGYVDELGALNKRPGHELFANVGGSGLQGLAWWKAKNVFIAVAGGRIYKITDNAGAFEEVTGDTLETEGNVHFAATWDATNGHLIVMANGGRMVTYDNSNPTAYMADADAPTVVKNLTTLDGYLLADDQTVAGRVQFSDPLNVLTWSGADVFRAETRPDAIKYMENKNRELVIFQDDTVDFYRNNGTTPFARIEGAYVESGVIASESVLNIDGVWLFLDNKRRIATFKKRSTQSLSTPFDNEIRDITPVKDAVAMELDSGVRQWYVISMPAGDKTYVYDLSVGTWAEWGEWDTTNAVYRRYIGSVAAYSEEWDFILVGDRTTGKIYKLNPKVYQDDGEPIRTLIRTGYIRHGSENEKRSEALRLHFKRGVGGAGIEGTDRVPKIKIRWRDNDGTWGNWVEIDIRFENAAETFYHELKPMGRYRLRQFEIVHAENTPFVLSKIEEKVQITER